jgi:hypothetical protein
MKAEIEIIKNNCCITLIPETIKDCINYNSRSESETAGLEKLFEIYNLKLKEKK